MAGSVALDKEHPLAGAVVCFTSVQLEKKTQLANIAKEMGAIERPDLTSEVTHLFVGSANSAKYQFVARERNDVVVLHPEWIEALREPWMQGEDIDIQALEKEYKIPAFFNLTICITGFSDMALRTKMNDSAIENGAEFRRDLTKSVTHLVARTAEGEKFKFATQWGIKVVSEKWFHDCIERGMILDEEKYHPYLPLEEQGVGAWTRPSEQGQRGKQRPAPSDGSSDLRPRKKLRRTASRKLVGQNENIWGDIIGTGYMDAETNEPPKDADDDEDLDTPPRKPVIQAAKSFASESAFGDAIDRSHTQDAVPRAPEGFLSGTYFYLHRFSSKQVGILYRHLNSNGAQCVQSLSEFASPSIPKTGEGLYIMVPYQTPGPEIPSTDDLAFECEVVTDMWLEKCLHSRALVPPEQHVASTPFPKFPIPGFPGMRVCSTGFGGIDLLHVSKLVNLMGASYEEVLTPQASVLICDDPQNANVDKLRHTREWGVPAVSADWLWISIQSGQKKSFEPYLVRKQTSQTRKSLERPGAAFANEASPHQPTEKASTAKSKTPGASSNEERTEDMQTAKQNRNRVMPIMDDGFDAEDDAPKPSIPESRSPSPGRNEVNATEGARASKEAQINPNPAIPSALDTALKGLLQQAQAAKARQKNQNQDSTTTATEEGDIPQRRKRKPLLGRAPSHSSTKALEATRAPSRASSIDTLNDDGLGPSLESGDPSQVNSLSRTNSRVNDQSLSSMFSGGGGKFDFLDKQPLLNNEEDEENTAPQMTQLDYEDADAAAMRAEFLRDAGKLPSKPKHADPGLLIDEAREMEDVGWASRRRTRKHPRDED